MLDLESKRVYVATCEGCDSEQETTVFLSATAKGDVVSEGRAKAEVMDKHGWVTGVLPNLELICPRCIRALVRVLPMIAGKVEDLQEISDTKPTATPEAK
jgi:hypothetical protein